MHYSYNIYYLNVIVMVSDRYIILMIYRLQIKKVHKHDVNNIIYDVKVMQYC